MASGDGSSSVTRLSAGTRDATGRRRAEEALRESETILQRLLASASEAVVIVDGDGRIVLVSARTKEMFGYSRDELLGQTVETLIPGRFRDAHAQHRADYVSHPRTRTMGPGLDLVGQRKDGTEFPVEIGLSFIETDGGPLIMSIIADISERKRAEEEVRLLLSITQAINAADNYPSTLEAVLREVCEATGWDYGEAWLPHPNGTILESSPAWYSTTDALTTFRLVSEQITFPPGAGLPGRVWSSKQPEWIEDLWTKPDTVFFRAGAAQEAGLKAGLGIPITANREVLAVLVFFVSEPRKENQRLVELISAVTQQLGSLIQRKQAEDALRDSKLLLEKTFASLDEAVFVVDPNTRTIIACNSAAERVFGYSEKEMLGRNTEFLHVDRATYENFGRKLFPALEAAGVFHTEYQVRRKDGSILSTEHTVTEIVDDSGQRTGLVSVLRDVTDRKRMEEQLQVAREELESKVEHQLLRRNPYGLTFRELTVLHLVAAGKSDKEIGIGLGISPLTAQKHISNILAKMDAASRTEAVARGLREGLLD